MMQVRCQMIILEERNLQICALTQHIEPRLQISITKCYYLHIRQLPAICVIHNKILSYFGGRILLLLPLQLCLISCQFIHL